MTLTAPPEPRCVAGARGRRRSRVAGARRRSRWAASAAPAPGRARGYLPPVQARLRHQPREQGLRRDVGSRLGRAVPVADAAQPGRAARRSTTAPRTTACRTTSRRSAGRGPTRRRRATARCSATSPAPAPRRPGRPSATGCVYPGACPPSPGQLDAAGMTWHGYMEDMGTAAAGTPRSGAPDDTQKAQGRRPVRDPAQPVRVLPLGHRRPGHCAAHVVDLTALTTDLACNGDDAEPALHHAQPVPRRPRRPVRRRPARRARLGRRVAQGDGSRASSLARVQAGRLLIITFDEADGPAERRHRVLRRGARAELARCPASPAWAAAASARWCSRRSTRPGQRRAPRRTTTTRCCAASRTSSACPPRLRGTDRPQPVRPRRLQPLTRSPSSPNAFGGKQVRSRG